MKNRAYLLEMNGSYNGSQTIHLDQISIFLMLSLRITCTSRFRRFRRFGVDFGAK